MATCYAASAAGVLVVRGLRRPADGADSYADRPAPTAEEAAAAADD